MNPKVFCGCIIEIAYKGWFSIHPEEPHFDAFHTVGLCQILFAVENFIVKSRLKIPIINCCNYFNISEMSICWQPKNILWVILQLVSDCRSQFWG